MHIFATNTTADKGVIFVWDCGPKTKTEKEEKERRKKPFHG